MGQRAGNQRVWQGLLRSCWPLTGRGRPPGSPLLTGAPGGQAPQPGPSRKHPPAVRGSPSHLPPRRCLQQAFRSRFCGSFLSVLFAKGGRGSGNHVLSARRAVWAGDTGRWGLPRGSGLTVHRADRLAQCLDRLLSCATAWKGILLFWGAAPPHVLGLPGSWGSPPPHPTPISLSTADWLRGQPAPVPVPRASCRWLKVRQLRTSPEGGGNTSSLQSRRVSSTLHEGKGGGADIHH